MSFAIASPSPRPDSGQSSIRVMVVDDAVVVRGLLTRWIEAEAGLQIVGSMRSGREAIEQLERANPDVVILDVDMPDTDGITALPRLLEKKRDLVVIMASTLTRRNAEISLRALSLGAADYIPKPQTTREITTSTSFRRELIDKIKALGSRRKPVVPARCRAATSCRGEPDLRRVARTCAAAGRRVRRLAPHEQGALKLRPLPLMPPRVLLVGASTGGPQALNSLLGRTQQRDRPSAGAGGAAHAADLHDHSRRAPVARRSAGRRTRPSTAKRSGPGGSISRPAAATCGSCAATATRRSPLEDGPLVNFCKPAVDPLFDSAAEIWGGEESRGRAHRNGLRRHARRGQPGSPPGGTVIAQDEETSVVWGMPGSVANAGLCSAVLPLDQIAPKIVRLFAGDRS